MNNYEIRDAQLLLDQVEQMTAVNKTIISLREQMEACIMQISNAWTSNTVDRDSYMSNINRNLVKLESWNTAVTTLAANLNSFANESIRIANNG